MIGRSLQEGRTNSSVDREQYPSRPIDHGEPCCAKPQTSRQRGLEPQTNFQSAEDCPAQIAIGLIQGKWKTRILAQLQHGPVRLGELRRTFPDASKKMLTQHLREMERDGLIARNDLSGRLRHVEYTLSDPRGSAVVHLVNALTRWSRENLPW
jgi:DNA-binding HxlR family transcriptional regulator